MPKMWLVARREFAYNLQRPSFLFAAFGTPLIIVGLWVLILLFFPDSTPTAPDVTDFGLVDEAGVLVREDPVTIVADARIDGEPVAYRFFQYIDAVSAQQALADAEIGAYYVIPESYLDDFGVDRFDREGAPDDLDVVFRRLLIEETSLSAGIDSTLWDRIDQPVRDMSVVLKNTGRELTQDALPVLLLTPFFFAIVFFLAMQTTSTFLMNGLVEEKKNRIIEVIVTTISPLQLLAGKIMGLGALGLVQVGVWLVVAVAAFVVGPEVEALAVLGEASIPLDMILIGVSYFTLWYFLNASIMATIGVVTGSEQQASQYAVFVTLPGYLLPIVLLTTFISDPNGPLPTILSLIPFTSAMSMVLRVGFGVVPLWQIGLGLVVLVATTLFTAWASAKVFRWALLLYGKRITLRDMLSVVRSPEVSEVPVGESRPVREES